MIHLLSQYRDFIVLVTFLLGACYLVTMVVARIERSMR